MAAAMAEDEDAVRRVLKAGADVSTPDNFGKTAWDVAVDSDHEHIMEMVNYPRE